MEDTHDAIIGGEEGIQSLGEDVEDAGVVLATPVEGVHGLLDGERVAEVGDGGQQLGEDEDVIEGDGHAGACEGVTHVVGVAEEDHAAGHLLGGGEPRVGHGARNLAVFESLESGWAYGFGQRWDGVVLDVAADAAVGWRRLGDARGHIEEGAGLVGADLVEEDGCNVADDDVAETRLGELGVDELEGVELAAEEGFGGGDFLAERGVVAVGDDGELSEKVVGNLFARVAVLGLGSCLDAQDLVGVFAAYRVDNFRLEDGNVLVRQAGFA